jgi:hypothetical protein
MSQGRERRKLLRKFFPPNTGFMGLVEDTDIYFNIPNARHSIRSRMKEFDGNKI